MAVQFEKDGIAFSYPENWQLEREESDNGWTVTVQSPDTAFFMVSDDEDMPEHSEMAGGSPDTSRAEYPDLEFDERVENIAGQPAVGHDIRFFSFDLTNSCWERSFYGPGGTLLVLWQANDLELEKNEPILQAMCKS